MAYTIEYQLSHDIDIFFDIDEFRTIHIATAGAELPSELASLNKTIINNKKKAFELASSFEIEINPYLDKLLNFTNNNEKDLYLTEFIMIAQKGIITFDKTNINNVKDPYYHVVAWPKNYTNKNKIFILETPKFISKKLIMNINKNIENSKLNNKRYDKFKIFNEI